MQGQNQAKQPKVLSKPKVYGFYQKKTKSIRGGVNPFQMGKIRCHCHCSGTALLFFSEWYRFALFIHLHA